MRMRAAATAAIVLAALGLAGCERRDWPTVDRPFDAVVLTGADLPGLIGVAPGRVVAFRFVFGIWQQVPVQVDERVVLDLARPKNLAPIGSTARFYTDPGTWTGPDPDPALDADDEVVFMVRDAFGQARDIDEGGYTYTRDEPPGVVAGSGLEIEVSDPLGTDERSWVYLFESDGTLDPSAGRSYVDYDFVLVSGDYKSTYRIGSGPNPEQSSVTTPAYSQRFTDRWVTDQTRVTAGGASGVDLLDAHKSGFAGNCARSEGTFSNGPGAMIANKSGPVRAIRSYLGANSGTYTQRDHLLYDQRAEVVTYLRVHAIPPVRDWFDYSPAAIGMTFSASNAPAGVTIDGVPDSVPAAFPSWQMVTGAPGTLVHTATYDTSIASIPGNLRQYYSDDSTPAEVQCTGDAYEYGASGSLVAQNVPCTDPAMGCTDTFTSTRRTTFLPPGATPADAGALAAQTAAPLTATVSAYAP